MREKTCQFNVACVFLGASNLVIAGLPITRLAIGARLVRQRRWRRDNMEFEFQPFIMGDHRNPAVNDNNPQG